MPSQIILQFRYTDQENSYLSRIYLVDISDIATWSMYECTFVHFGCYMHIFGEKKSRITLIYYGNDSRVAPFCRLRILANGSYYLIIIFSTSIAQIIY